MIIEYVNLGVADKGNGDPIRVAFDKVNKNFEKLNNSYANLAFDLSGISTETKLNEFDFGKISGNEITSPIQLLFLTTTMDLGEIKSPSIISYDAGDFY